MANGESLLLAIDVGNSRIKCGLVERADSVPTDCLPRCLYSAAIAITDSIPWETLAGWTADAGLKALPAVMAGSNLSRIEHLNREWPTDRQPPLVIAESNRFPLAVNLPEPSAVGIDRLLNAVAVNRIRPSDRPAVIVDCGTATTVDFVSDAGAFEGGAILSGFGLSAQALHEYTDRLPLVDVAALEQSSPNPVGRNTAAAIQSGLFWGQVGAVRELIARFADETVSPLVLLTGGGGSLLKPYLPEVIYEPHLSLQGLSLAARSLSHDESDACGE